MQHQDAKSRILSVKYSQVAASHSVVTLLADAQTNSATAHCGLVVLQNLSHMLAPWRLEREHGVAVVARVLNMKSKKLRAER